MNREYNFFIEIWLRGFAKKYIRSFDDSKEHPHITLVRPFSTTVSDAEVIASMKSVCDKEERYTFFSLNGFDVFENDQDIAYMHVHNQEPMLRLSEGFESALEGIVNFSALYDKKRTLHATITDTLEKGTYQHWLMKHKNFDENIEQALLRVTLLKNKRILAEYDFPSRTILSREESLNKD